MGIDPNAGCNWELTDWSYCTLETCCLMQGGVFLYLPSFGGNVFFAVFFGLFIIPNLWLGIKHKTWGYMAGMVVGLFLEVLGYAARLMLHNNPWDGNGFLLYLIAITIAPVFITAAIYLCISRIMITYGAHNARVLPKYVAIGFVSTDIMSLVLQAVGGAIADTAGWQSSLQQTGINIMIAGLVLQVIGLAVFLIVCADFAWRCKRGTLDMAAEKVETRRRTILKLTIGSLMLATVCVLIRSVFRVVELWQGFSGELWNDEVDFMVLDGGMVAIATICLTAFHPGIGFGRQWHAANWSFRTKKVAGMPVPLSMHTKSESSETS